MNKNNLLDSSLVWGHLGDAERNYISDVFDRFDGYPTLHQLWQLIDEQWQTVSTNGCYGLLIIPYGTLGLFIEQDRELLALREAHHSNGKLLRVWLTLRPGG